MPIRPTSRRSLPALAALLALVCASHATSAQTQYQFAYSTRFEHTVPPPPSFGSTLRIGRLDMLLTYTDLRCHYHLRRSRGLAFHRQVRCDHTHGRHPDVRYTGGL